ncbi:MAG TPA: hypothetical protein VK254_04890 [Candidatus Bathyarchaeia archaeon]|nr:hypothetical protein [Candidatus Bathyarchaeia archaeon]
MYKHRFLVIPGIILILIVPMEAIRIGIIDPLLSKISGFFNFKF